MKILVTGRSGQVGYELMRSLQPLGLYAANSIFVGDYLTTEGQAGSLDREMIRDLGFDIVGDDSGEGSVVPLVDRVTLTSRQARLAK